MKKLLLIIILMFLLFTAGCEIKSRIATYEFEDFKYYIYQINDEGKIIFPETENRNVVDEYITIIGFSEQGLTKEIIIVPETIEGIRVKEIGKKGFWGSIGDWESDNLRRVYIPFDVTIWGGFKYNNPKFERALILEFEIDRAENYVRIASYNRKDSNIYGFVGNGAFYANVSYMFNYDDSPNYGYYWIDDYDYGTKITYIPENPTRDGYIFGGWYKEEECINKWDFDVDKLPNPLYDKEKRVLYQETILYAKWVKER